MSFAKLNMFITWVLIPITFVLGWVAFTGRMLLELLNVSTAEGSIPGIIIGMLLVFAAVFIIQHVRGELWPVGNSTGHGYVLGQRLVLAANVLALLILAFRLGGHLLSNRDLMMVFDRFTDAFGYWVMAMWAIAFSFLYQSTLSTKAQA
jgi:hypothetical protein